MSKGWAGGSTRSWRRTRLLILSMHNYTCQIQGPDCTGYATHVDHIKGKGVSEAIEDLRAACQTCNLQRGQPKPEDPKPNPTVKWW